MGLFGTRIKTKNADGTKTVTATSNKGQRVKTKTISPDGVKTKNVTITDNRKGLSVSKTKDMTSGAGKPRSVTKKYSVEDKRYEDGPDHYSGTKTKSAGSRSKESCYENSCGIERTSKKKSFSPSGKKVKSRSYKITNK